MSRVKLTVHVSPDSGESSGSTVAIGDKAIKQLKIPAGSPITLRFGAFRQSVTAVGGGPADGLRLSAMLAHRMGLHTGAKLSAGYRQGSRTLAIGPLVGVLVSKVYPGSADGQLFGSITSFCRELTIAAALSGAHVFFFTPNEVNSGQTITGWSYRGGWRKSEYPVPDVVYNRLTTRKLESKSSVQHFFKEVKTRYQTTVFNERFLNKTDVFQALKQSAACLKYLPESYLFRGFDMLKSMTAKYPVVFLKPVTGSLGKGIIRISRCGNGYCCDTTMAGGVRRQTFATLNGLFKSISARLKAQRHQIQQGLQLIKIGDRPIDFRALVQRGSKGDWVITSTVARIAGNRHFVSNIARGGTIARVEETLTRSNLPSSALNTTRTQLRRAALDIAEGIEAQVGGHYAELGVDLAVDVSGKVWLLEVNSKPSKNDASPAANVKIRPSVKQTLRYARYLAGL